MTACPEWKDRLLDFTLGIPACIELQEHLSGCTNCSQALSELRAGCKQMDWALQRLVQDAEPSPAFRARFLASLEARPAVWKRWPLRAAGLAAVAALVASLLVPWVIRVAGPQEPSLGSISTLLQWRSPTQALLSSPADELLKAGPKLGGFYFRIDTLSPPRSDDMVEKGDRRRP